MLNPNKKYENITMVCVSEQFESEILIHEASKIAHKTSTKLYVINIQKKYNLGNKISKELKYLLMISKKLDAKMLIFFSDNPVTILKDCIERRNVKHIILGKSGDKVHEIEKQLHAKFKDIEIHTCKYK